MKTIPKPYLLILGLVGCLPLAAAHNTNKITKYITNLGSNPIQVIVKTGITVNGQTKIQNIKEKEILPGAKNVAVTIPGKELYQIEFSMVSKLHPEKDFQKGDLINQNNYFLIDDDMMVSMTRTPF